MTNPKRAALRRWLDIEWEKVRADYRAAGKPFGNDGLDIWVEYGQLTTVN